MLEIYTDGAYSSSRDQGGWCFVVVFKDKIVYEQYDSERETTNNRMEIHAVIESLKWMIKNKATKAIIYTDSMYVIGTMTQNWKRNKNNDLWEIMDDVYSKVKIKFKHVKGHAGHKFNERCDLLAVNGSHLIY